MPPVDDFRLIISSPRVLSVFVAAALLSACAQVPPPPPPEIREVRVEVQVPVEVPVIAPADVVAQQFFAYNDRLRQMNGAELAQETAVRNDGSLTAQTCIQLALALLFTHNNGDLQRAQTLIDQVMRGTPADSEHWQEIARLLNSRVAEQRRLEEQIERLNQQLRDSQRDSQRKLDQLNEKLEALKAIERSLNARPAPATPAASAAKPGHP